MELEFLSFTLGFVGGAGLFGFGLIVGFYIKKDTPAKLVEAEDYDPDEKPVDEIFFEESWTGDGEFPTDAELEELHRHSNY